MIKMKSISPKVRKKGIKFILVTSLSTVTLTGCGAMELSTNVTNKYDTIDTNSDDSLKNGIKQVIDVPGEQFKLVVEYNCNLEEGEDWTITSNKKVFSKIYTQGLPKDTKVYIDNIHIDTTIIASHKNMDGITQDTMDDHIHNSLMIGFPISDDVAHYLTNSIEGQNDSFISGTFYGMNSYASGEIRQKRFLESDYLKEGVYANLITTIYDLAIQGPDELEPHYTDVDSDLAIKVSNKVAFYEDEEIYYNQYEIDEYGNVTTTKIDEYGNIITNGSESKKKTKKK